ncbi:SDR family oxidoreductase [Mycobacterium lentiflavum]|uniref:SDR family oxidoreductase n=1 Tax=Mycobacterium lentiflavum TaxID=141349 RepID=A0ABY3V0A9_MYCLN|nr:SDR family oxidoreductase [Mycobacterium lentiflavum]ULP45281.1 SDR family oxidoreductase [Mycobacterium lentiflavum]
MLSEHVVLIIGGGSGLGLGIARHCRDEGAQVAVMEVSAEKVTALKEEFGDDILAVQGDVTLVEDLQRCRTAVVEQFGRLDALIGCQGIFDGNVALRDVPVESVPALFDEVLRINALGHILAARVFVDLLEQSEGAIVLTASVAAYAADGGGLMYTASKGAVVSIINQLAFEFAPRVRVNGVAPSTFTNSQLRGPAALGLESQKQSDIPKEDFLRLFLSLVLLQELPTPEDFAPLYAFLASRHNKIMTGQTIIADQGMFNRAVLSKGAA